MPTYAAYKQGYDSLWDGVIVTNVPGAKAEAQKLLKYRSVYEALEKKTGVPWFCIGIIHTREAGSGDVGRWLCTLHNGERIIGTGRKTTIVPIGKGPFKTFEDAAVDALKGYNYPEWNASRLAWTLEKFNGFGYRTKGIPSPYLWGGTNEQKRGKFVADRKYDPNVMDPQVGGMAILKELMVLDASVSFGKPITLPEPTPHEPEPETQKAPVPESTKAGGAAVVTGGFFAYIGAHPVVILAAVVIAVALYIAGRVAWDIFQEQRQQKTAQSPKTD